MFSAQIYHQLLIQDILSCALCMSYRHNRNDRSALKSSVIIYVIFFTRKALETGEVRNELSFKIRYSSLS